MPMATSAGAKINSSINVTPMVDVTLVVLIIFMVVVPMIHGSHIRLATANNPVAMPDANKIDAMIVSIMRDGQVFFGGQRINGDALAQKVKEHLHRRTDKTVFVSADARVRYSVVVNAVDDVRSAGADELGLLTEKEAR